MAYEPPFKEKLSPFLQEKLDLLKKQYGPESRHYKGLALQYVFDPREGQDGQEANLKHYEAEVLVENLEDHLAGLERLYRRTLVIEPTLVCAAHCRYCLRSNYPRHTLTETQLIEVAKYCGSDVRRDTLNEVLITGGDPLMIPKRLGFLVDALMEYAPNIKIFRIATRLTAQYPEKVDEAVFSVFRHKPGVRFELATQINHPVEFFPEVQEVFAKFRELNVKIYAQNVLLKGVNDDIDTLVELYDLMRRCDIEAHYLFHCVPMRGMHYLRPSVDKGLRLIQALTAGGRISGRVKPMFAAMTDIGKITFYDGAIKERKNGRMLLQSQYRLEDRRRWNPSWQIPPNAEVDEDGFLRVWYLDGEL